MKDYSICYLTETGKRSGEAYSGTLERCREVIITLRNKYCTEKFGIFEIIQLKDE